FGGAAPWADPKGCEDLPFDLIVAGEGDHPDTIKTILDYAEEKNKRIYFPEISRNLDWVLPPLRRWSLNYHAYMRDRNTGINHRMSSMFTSRGCGKACAFCIEENQRVLMSDWSWKPIKDIKVGDMVMSMNGGRYTGIYPKMIPTKVLNVWNKGIKETITISDDQSSLQLTPDHKIYADDGNDTRWKLAKSTVENKYKFRKFYPSDRTNEFKRGWLSGYIAGDGCIHKRAGKTNITITSRDDEMLDILQDWAKEFGCNLRKFKHMMGNSAFPTKLDSKYINGVQCTNGTESDTFIDKISETSLSRDYRLGWLAGMYDADGTLDVGRDCRIFQSQKVNPQNTERIEQYLDFVGIHYNIQYGEDNQKVYIMNMAKFLLTCRPMMKRKYPDDYDYRSLPKFHAHEIQKSGNAVVYDIETETHTFICEGFIVHNCESGRHGVIWDRLVRFEPLDVVEHQIKELNSLGFTGIGFYDDVLPVNKKRVQELMKLTTKYNMVWRCFLRTDIICHNGGKDYLEEMRDGGLIEIFVGVESADNQIKENIFKG
ncbi:MAG: LAGLIDADG family homing endonuclease, partial [Nitrososphaeraceae archaeon]|nr:LAGLIDADG family homing endonuclease [Nitrososphaeraceae archaeon]